MPELLATLGAARDKSNNERRFQIALAGGDPDAAEDGGLTFDQIREQEQLRAAGIINEDTPDEIANAIAAGNVYFVD